MTDASGTANTSVIRQLHHSATAYTRRPQLQYSDAQALFCYYLPFVRNVSCIHQWPTRGTVYIVCAVKNSLHESIRVPRKCTYVYQSFYFDFFLRTQSIFLTIDLPRIENICFFFSFVNITSVQNWTSWLNLHVPHSAKRLYKR